MPRTATTGSGLDRRINDIVARAAHEIAQAVRQNIAEEVARLVGGRGMQAGGNISDGIGAGRKRRVITCPVPGCGKPGGGPKWGWFCAEHKDLPASEKEKIRAAARGQTRATVSKPGRKKK